AVSEIAKPPATRKPIVTAWIAQERAPDAYRRLTRLLDEGRQEYVVCPLIEASETSLARAAEDEAERLRRSELQGYRVGCLHGRLRPKDRRELMAQFKAGGLGPGARRVGRAARPPTVGPLGPALRPYSQGPPIARARPRLRAGARGRPAPRRGGGDLLRRRRAAGLEQERGELRRTGEHR